MNGSDYLEFEEAGLDIDQIIERLTGQREHLIRDYNALQEMLGGAYRLGTDAKAQSTAQKK